MVPQCTVLKASASVWLVKAALAQPHFLAAALLGHSSVNRSTRHLRALQRRQRAVQTEGKNTS